MPTRVIILPCNKSSREPMGSSDTSSYWIDEIRREMDLQIFNGINGIVNSGDDANNRRNEFELGTVNAINIVMVSRNNAL